MTRAASTPTAACSTTSGEGLLMVTEGVRAKMIENAAQAWPACRSVRCRSIDEIGLDLGSEDHEGRRKPISAPPPSSRQKIAAWTRWSRSWAGSGARTARASTTIPREGAPKKLWPDLADLLPEKNSTPTTLDVDVETEAAPPGHPGGRGRAHRGRQRDRRSARGGCRLDPRLRLCAVHRRHACPTST